MDAGCPETDMFHQSIMLSWFCFFKESQVESFGLQPQISWSSDPRDMKDGEERAVVSPVDLTMNDSKTQWQK